MNHFQRALSLGLLLFNVPENDGAEGGSNEKPKSVGARIASLIRSHGGAEAALGATVAEVVALKRENADLKRRPEGPTLTAEEKAEYDAFKALGVKPADVKTAIEQYPVLQAQVESLRFRELADEAAASVADGVQWKGKVLHEILSARGQMVELREVKEKDKAGQDVTVKRPFVRSKGDDKAEWKPLSQYIATDAADYLPALGQKVEATPAPTKGVPLVATTPVTGGNQGGGLLGKKLAQMKERQNAPSPLSPERKTA